MKNVRYSRIAVLNEPDAVSLILYLEEYPDSFTTDLRKAIPNYDRLKRLIETMNVEGLLILEIIDDPRNKITYRLTEKGMKVAKKLREIEEMMVR